MKLLADILESNQSLNARNIRSLEQKLDNYNSKTEKAQAHSQGVAQMVEAVMAKLETVALQVHDINSLVLKEQQNGEALLIEQRKLIEQAEEKRKVEAQGGDQIEEDQK